MVLDWPGAGRCLKFFGLADIISVPVHPSTTESIDGRQTGKPCPRFVARQPILTGDQKIFGYELLFRDGLKNYVAKPKIPRPRRVTPWTSPR